MLLSKASEYAIKACIYVASRKENDPKAGAAEISEKIMAPQPFTSKILKQLAREGIISSTKGPGGGFFMIEKQVNQPIIDIIVAIDGDKLFKGCVLGLSSCSETQPCPIHSQYEPIRTGLRQLMKNNTLGSLAQSYGSGTAFLARLGQVSAESD